MKVSLNWLRELVELPPTADELVHLLTMAGVEVEGIAVTGCAIPGIVVAEIRESVQHPNADRLSVCKVDDGSGTERQIVCGAKNYRVGDKVPLALPGAQLAPDFVIKVGKLRGVESQGMMCSAEELGLPATLGARGAEDGLLILPAEVKPGTPFAEVFGSDTVLDLEITPNRPDLLCVWGIAREIAVLSGKTLPQPFAWPKIEPGGLPAPAVAVESVSPVWYSAAALAGVKIGPSPEWLKRKIESVGLRSINNAVDVTNFLMIGCGQPAHVFDAAKIAGTIRVRDAHEGETLSALDGKTYTLAPGDLVIADDENILALAGVIGGEASGVTGQTRDIVLEVANFEPGRIRRTSRRLGISTDSSYRFERGVALLNSTMVAGGLAGRLLAEVTGATALSAPAIVDNCAALVKGALDVPAVIPFRKARAEALIGVQLDESRVDAILSGFGLSKAADGWRANPLRPDLTREVDLIEEVARVIGMDAVPPRTQGRFAAGSGMDRAYDRAMAMRRGFVAQGLHEARSITLVPAEPLGLGCTRTSPDTLLRVKNPMIEEQVVLRPNLVHGLFTAVRDNLRAGAENVRLFEIGRVFLARKPEEFLHAAVVLTGPVRPRTWRGGEERIADLFDLKALLSVVLGEGVSFEADANPALALSLVVKMGGKPCGFAGQLWPADARGLDAETPVVFAELDLAALWKTGAQDASGKYREIPRFPAMKRDIAMLAPLTLAHEEVARALAGANEPLLAGVELFDVFCDPAGARIPADRKSLAYSLTYRSPGRTLTADEVNAAHGKLKDRLRALGVELRE